MIKRREFIAGLGSTAAWPVVAAGAQQPDRMRRIGVLMGGDENDSAWRTRLSAFTQALADLGWTDGRNLRMDVRWAGGGNNRIRALAREVVGSKPDIVVTGGNPASIAVQRETRTIPIVFVNVGDPVANGLVARLDRPSGNITGFATNEASTATEAGADGPTTVLASIAEKTGWRQISGPLFRKYVGLFLAVVCIAQWANCGLTHRSKQPLLFSGNPRRRPFPCIPGRDRLPMERPGG
jgi:hypothetical protein